MATLVSKDVGSITTAGSSSSWIQAASVAKSNGSQIAGHAAGPSAEWLIHGAFAGVLRLVRFSKP